MFRQTRMAAWILAATLVFSGLALAHDRDDDDDYYRGNQGQARQYGYQQGYRDGAHHGREDRARNTGYEVRSEDWERARRGYASWMGSFGQFRKGYQDGYRRGYDTAFYSQGYRFPATWGHGGWRGHGDGDDGDDDADDRGYGRDRNRNDQPWFRGGDVAYQYGYQDGSSVAREDIAKGKSYNPNPRGRYDDADRGYNSRHGDKHAYKARYSEGYRAGYTAVRRY